MSSTYWNADWKRLECELRSKSFVELLETLKSEGVVAVGTCAWSEVFGPRSASGRAPLPPDEILFPMLIHHRAERDPRWRTVILAALWSGLRAIHAHRWRWDRDDAERWTHVLWCFNEAVYGFDPAQRSSRLARLILQRTTHRLFEHYGREWRRHRRELRVDGRRLATPALGAEAEQGEGMKAIFLAQVDPGFAGIEVREEQQLALARLRGFLDDGTVSLRDFLLLRATRFHGMGLADYCRDVGLDLAVGIKRRARAEARMAAADRKDRKRRALLLSRSDQSGGL